MIRQTFARIPSIQPPNRAVMPRRDAGYILLFALGLMALVATLVLSVTVMLRLDAQLLTREKTALQEEYLLRGAARYAALQLAITSAVTTLKPPLNEAYLRQWPLWRPSGRTYEVNLGGTGVLVQLEDISGLPDANALTVQQWERLFLLLGSSSPHMAKGLAARVTDLKEQLLRVRGTAGFTSVREILEWNEIPSSMRFGGSEKVPLGLRHLIVVGTRSTQIDLNTTPLPLLQVLGNVTNEHLQQLATLRKAGQITPAQSQQWLRGTGLTARATDAPPTAVKARLRMASAPAQVRAMVAVIAYENGSFGVVDQMMDQGMTGQ